MALLVVSNRVIENAQWFSGPEQLEHYLSTRDDIDNLLFPFWSWKVPNSMLKKYKCYGVHCGPLLEGRGRGGSPIDNLKTLGVKYTTLCIFEMNERFDEGRVRVAIPIDITQPKEYIIGWIDGVLPRVVDYLLEPYEHIPEKFKRLPNAK